MLGVTVEGGAPAIVGSDPLKSDRLPSATRNTDNPRKRQLQRICRLTSRLDSLVIWRDDIQRRIDDLDARLWEQNWFFSRVYQDEVDDLTDAVAAWRLAAARVVINIMSAEGRRAA